MIQSLSNLYFSSESLQTILEIYSASHLKYYNYLSERQESDLIHLAEIITEDKIKSLTGKKLDNYIECRIGIILRELLELIEDSKIVK